MSRGMAAPKRAAGNRTPVTDFDPRQKLRVSNLEGCVTVTTTLGLFQIERATCAL